MADEDASFPFRDLVGFTVDTHADGATAVVEVGPQHLNPHGVLHGGVAFTLIDTAMGAAAQAAVDDGLWCTTIDIHTRFLRPVTAGRLTAHATVRRRGRRVVHVDGVLSDGDGVEYVSAVGTFAVIVPGT